MAPVYSIAAEHATYTIPRGGSAGQGTGGFHPHITGPVSGGLGPALGPIPTWKSWTRLALWAAAPAPAGTSHCRLVMAVPCRHCLHHPSAASQSTCSPPPPLPAPGPAGGTPPHCRAISCPDAGRPPRPAPAARHQQRRRQALTQGHTAAEARPGARVRWRREGDTAQIRRQTEPHSSQFNVSRRVGGPVWAGRGVAGRGTEQLSSRQPSGGGRRRAEACYQLNRAGERSAGPADGRL